MNMKVMMIKWWRKHDQKVKTVLLVSDNVDNFGWLLRAVQLFYKE